MTCDNGGMTAQLALYLVALADKVPTANQTVAGWGGFAMFAGLAVAVALLCWSFVRQLKKTQQNADRGVFDPSDRKPRRTSI